jgi:hypothetical protein
MTHAEALELGASSRRQKEELEHALDDLRGQVGELMMEVETRDRELHRMRAEAREALGMVEDAEASRSWRLGHGLMRILRRLTGRGREKGSALTAAAARLGQIEGAPAPRYELPADGVSYLFISGCARSGTSATVTLLNHDPRVAVGMERFKYLRGRIRPHHFRPDYFLNPSPDETNIMRPELYRDLRRKWEAERPSFVGDKVFTHRRRSVLPHLWHQFSEPKLLYLLRDPEAVAGSYERRLANPADVNWPHDHRRAVEDWNLNVAALRELAAARPEADFFVVRYERLFSGDAEYLAELFGYLGLPVSPEVEAGFAELTSGWPKRQKRGDGLADDQRAYVRAHTNADLAAWISGQPGAGPPPAA